VLNLPIGNHHLTRHQINDSENFRTSLHRLVRH
jgi:hypothetical protein